MDTDTNQKMKQVNALVDEYRVTCLWYLREDYYPETFADACRVLDAIARHGDAMAFRRAATLRQWLSQSSSDPFAG